MLEFITNLKQRYQIIQSGLAEESRQWSSFQTSIEQLILIESFLHKEQLIEHGRLPINIAIIGPTQSGKSTVVNLLLNQNAAGVSPLAGYTVHPQGFAVDLQTDDLAYIAQYFSGFQEVQQLSLNAEKYTCYSLNHVSASHLSACMLWDTPDFDSIDAQSYREGVLKSLALADVLVLVVSKEKYADQSVWDAMALIEPLNQPVLVVINKLIADSQSLVVDSFKERWQQIRQDKVPDILPVLFSKGLVPQDRQAELISLLRRSMHKVKRKKHETAATNFIKQHWQSWLAPVRSEQEAQTTWQILIDQAVKQAIVEYQRDYLNHPHHYDTFQNAMAKLLTLLEVPGLANVIAQSRKILAWPLRKIFSLGKHKYDRAYPKTQETAVLQQIAERVFLQLGDKVLDQIDQTQDHNKWWKAINSQLRQEKIVILKHFEYNTEAYHQGFKQEIENTAQGLFHKLEEHPALLNGLRATRISADAAMLALAVQAGGIGLHDLLIAPAMLSVTSYLAESAIGSYLQRAETELKQHQLNAVQHQLFTLILHKELANLPEKMMHNTYFNISPNQLAEAEAQLEQKRHGLRIL
ncbi:GTP-binding protein [Methyloprofundus sedimenti]|uniref:GTP-binding protein n=1 Tax=Methyloprofundus sedimenti TaxID=1420851 RepID=A0A1V8M879_9GAMM|nr:GTPase domain-containing protein [Methyloprofundus sedimenti]OQK17716.1 GTP-binding protein [Methyloprofundus sedimenti]